MKLLIKGVQGVTVDFAHLDNVWDWQLIESECSLPRIKYMHRIHALCVFWLGDSIAIKWKQYLTSPDWSRSVIIVPPHLSRDVASWRPARVEQAFDPKFVSSNLHWLHKLGIALADIPGADRGKDLEHLAGIVAGKVDREKQVTIDQVLRDIKHCSRQHQHGKNALSGRRMPEDVLVQLFPGADHPEMPADALLEIPDRWVPKGPTVIAPESFVICKAADAQVHGMAIPFTLGVVVGPIGGHSDQQLTVQWWVPPIGPMSQSSGRWTSSVDIFGTWRPFGSMTLKEARDVVMPSVQVDRASVLIGPIELDDGKLPFQTLDTLIDVHGIDVTGLTWTRTKNGSVFRNYRLLTR